MRTDVHAHRAIIQMAHYALLLWNLLVVVKWIMGRDHVLFQGMAVLTTNFEGILDTQGLTSANCAQLPSCG